MAVTRTGIFVDGALCFLCFNFVLNVYTTTAVSACDSLSLQVIPVSPSSVVAQWELDNTSDVSGCGGNVTTVDLSFHQEYDKTLNWTLLGTVDVVSGFYVIYNLPFAFALTCVRLSFDDVTEPRTIAESCNRTTGKAPSMSPANFSASCKRLPEHFNQREATFQWKEVPRQHQNGIIDGYRLEIKSHGSDQCCGIYDMDANTTELHIQGGLSMALSYVVTLVAHNRFGESPPTRYRLAPLKTPSIADTINTSIFVTLIILGILVGAWWVRRGGPVIRQTRDDYAELFRNSPAFNKSRKRGNGKFESLRSFRSQNNYNETVNTAV